MDISALTASQGKKEDDMKPCRILSVPLLLLGLSFGLAGCESFKPLEHSIGKHSQQHHGIAAKQHKEEHPFD